MKQNEHIPVKNIYYMLSYAFQVLKQDNYRYMETEEFGNIYNLFAAILSTGIGQQLKQGLYREYIARNEDLPTLRGKIDMARTIRNKMARRRVLACEYDELSANNLLNQILKTTVLLLLKRVDVEQKHKDALKKEMLFFSEVDTIDLRSVSWKSIRFHRNNQTYRMLINLCQLVAEGMLLSQDEGKEWLASFDDNQFMHRLYEKFILEYYRKEHPQLSPSPSHIKWATEEGIQDALLPTMLSDITLTSHNRVLIIDAKYYGHTLLTHYEKTSIRSGHLYQIFTYVKNKAEEVRTTHEVAGMLLYAQTDEETKPNKTFNISSNRIGVHTLNLNQEFSAISHQLDQIVAEFF